MSQTLKHLIALFTACLAISAIASDLTPQSALEDLQKGNERFTSGKMIARDLMAQVKETAKSQHPNAVILNCIDSRTPPELIFDQGIGDMFAVRMAGNISNPDVLGSLEFATKITGAKLIAVVGHTNCGAIKGACGKAKLGNLTGLLRKINPAVLKAQKEMGTNDCHDAKLINQIAKDNVMMVMDEIKKHSPVIRKMIASGDVELVGGMQNLETGEVTFF